MKKSLCFGILGSVVAAVMLASCSGDEFAMGSSSGSISPTLGLDTEVKSAKPQGRAADAITVEELSLRLQSADGSVSKEWSSVSEFDKTAQFRVGTYTMEAFKGSLEDEGFEKPYYYGSTSLEVEENKTTPVALTAKLANSMVTVLYTDAFKDYFTSYGLKIHADGGAYLDYAAGETRPVYVRPGNVTITADVVKQNGVSASLEAAVFTAKAQYHHTVTLDVNGGNAGDAQLVITYDETIDNKVEEVIDLSDAVLNAPAPEVLVEGFDPAVNYTVVSGMSTTLAPKLKIIARGGISAVTMTTDSKTLIEQGWIADIDLANATSAQQSALQSLGLKVNGLFGNVDKMAVIDLSGVMEHLLYREAGNNTTKITITVKDKVGKVTEPVTLTIDVEAIELVLTTTDALYFDDATASVDLSFNGGDVAENVTFSYLNERGTYTATDIVSVTPLSKAMLSYKVVVKVPAALDPVVLKAECNGVSSETLSISRVKAKYSLTASDNNAFAKYALLQILDEEGNVAGAPSDATIQISTGGNYSDIAFTASGNYVKLSDLTPATAYKARVVADGIPSPVVSFTTEATAQIPDSGFETWHSTKKGDYQYLWTVNTGTPWATVNDLTTSESGSGSGNGASTGGCAYKATSGTIPANGRSTKSNCYGGIIGTKKDSDGHTEGNATLHSNMGYSGNAALIRTVGYGNGNTTGAGLGNPASGFSTCQNVASGELYLGTYSGGANYSGYTFASRPSSISFYYRYTSYGSSGDYGDCEVIVSDASGNTITTANCQFTAQDSYIQKTLNLTYPEGSAKAAKIMVRFKSSANPSLGNNETWLYGPGNKNVSGGEYVGSELYIDEINLQY